MSWTFAATVRARTLPKNARRCRCFGINPRASHTLKTTKGRAPSFSHSVGMFSNDILTAMVRHKREPRSVRHPPRILILL